MLEDDTFIAHNGWAMEFAQALRDSGLGFKWGCNVRADLVVLGADPRYGGLTPAQWASFLMFVTAVAVFLRMRKLERLAELSEQGIEGLSLGQIAGKTVQDEARARVRLGQPLSNHPQHHFVRHQLAGIHHGFGLSAERCLGSHGCAQQVSGRYLRYVVLFNQKFCLCPFA